MLKILIEKLIQGKNLSSEESYSAVKGILAGATREQIAAFLVLLHAKGETPTELEGLVNALRATMTRVETDIPVLDIVGTGGDNANTVNISTASSLLAAACGAKVVKHGNRSVSSCCGSADLLELFGIQLDKTLDQIKTDLQQRGFAFCFAPNFHPSMNAIKAIRKSLGVRTSFNLLGPLLKPARASYLLIGVFHPNYLDVYADTVIKLGAKHAMIVHSCGLDELSLLGASRVIEIRDGQKEEKYLDPDDFGLPYCALEKIQGGDAEKNKQLIEKALTGTPGPIADTIIFNTGAALYVADIVSTVGEGIALAAEKIKTGDALKVIG